MLGLIVVPVITAFICYITWSVRLKGYINLAGSIILGGIFYLIIRDATVGSISGLGGLFYMDALSAYIMAIVIILGIASAGYSIGYIEHEYEQGLIDQKTVSRYYLLLHLFILSMLLVTISNNLAMLWISIEATTIVSSLLIGLGFHKRELAIEAAWKYIILCTVGITFALLGTFIAYYASIQVDGRGSLEWTTLVGMASRLDPETMKLAFIFVILGYGTKAGLAPLHNWLPDAHSMAPSPVSALLSGILLNTSFYGVLRFVSIVNPSTGADFTGGFLLTFGLLSVVVSSLFVMIQENYKRLLAYSSIEHMGIISIGAGIGGFAGLYGALLHILNHALAKPLMFFVSGKIQSKYGSTQMEDVRGVLKTMPFLGTITFIGVFSLTGMPPFNIFMSEFTVLIGIVKADHWIILSIVILCLVGIFYGMLKGFGKMLFGEPYGLKEPVRTFTISGAVANLIFLFMTSGIIVLGFYIPPFLDNTIRASLHIMGVQ